MSSLKAPVRLLSGGASLLRRAVRDGAVTPKPLSAPAGDGGTSAATVTFEPYRERRRFPWTLVSFIVVFVLPSLTAIAYFTGIASPQYAAEARLVVRSTEIAGADGKDDASPGTASQLRAPSSSSLKYSSTTQNAYIVAQYIRSRAIVEDLLKTVDLRQVFRRPEADFAARLTANASIEELVKYWEGMTQSYVDAPSGIVTFEVRAFLPDDALKIADQILILSERLVNEISKRAREDIMHASEEEVRQAAAQGRKILQELQIARDSEGMLDPLKAADDTSKLLLQMMAEKIKIESELFSALRTLDKDAPSVRHLRSRLEIAENQIAALKATVAGGGGPGRNIASSLRRFEELDRDRFVADKLLMIAEEALNRAQKRAERQNLYFMAFVRPSLPINPKYPHRLAYSLILPMAFLILWGIVTMTAAAIEDHRV